MKKAKNKNVTIGYLRHRAKLLKEAGYSKSRWIEFCEKVLELGLTMRLYEARRTVSKYITIKDPNDFSRSFKVRFSNHRPIKHRETSGDCDFFVGVTNLGTTTTEDAFSAVVKFFNVKTEIENGK